MNIYLHLHSLHVILQLSRLSMHSSTMSGIEDIYKAVNKYATRPKNSIPEDAIEESAYDTLENVVKSIRTDEHPVSFVPLPGPGGVTTATGKTRDGMLMSPSEPPSRTHSRTPPGLQSSTVSSEWLVSAVDN